MNSRSEIYKTIREMAEQVEQIRSTEEALRNQIDLMKEEVRRARKEGDRLEAAFHTLLESTVTALSESGTGLANQLQVIDCNGEKYHSRTYPKYKLIDGAPGVYMSRLDATRYLQISMAELSRLYMSGAVSVYKRGHGGNHGYRFKFSELEKYKRNLAEAITVMPQVTL